jgi:hypothetical protein
VLDKGWGLMSAFVVKDIAWGRKFVLPILGWACNDRFCCWRSMLGSVGYGLMCVRAALLSGASFMSTWLCLFV